MRNIWMFFLMCYSDILCYGGVFEKHISQGTQLFLEPLFSYNGFFSQLPLQNMIFLFDYTENNLIETLCTEEGKSFLFLLSCNP